MRQGVSHNCHAADIWACGVMLHYMLTEELPDPGGVPPGGRGSGGPLPDLQGVSAECRDLLRGMLRADPAERAGAWWIMNHPWFQMDCPEVSPNDRLIVSLPPTLSRLCISQKRRLC